LLYYNKTDPEQVIRIMAKKKLFYVITKGNAGGAQKYVLDLATHFSKEYEVTVLFGEGDHLERELSKKNIGTRRVASLQRDVSMFSSTFSLINPVRIFSSIYKEVQIVRELKKIFQKEKPHIVHLNSSKIGGIGGFAARLAGVPRIIFTGHGWYFNEPRSFPIRLIAYFLHWLTVLLSHVTIANSNKTKKDISFLPFMSNKVLTIRHGISPTMLNDRFALRSSLNIKETTFVIGTIAELHINKGLDVALRAIKKIPEVTYVIIGGGEKHKELTKLAKDLGIAERVIFLGAVPEGWKHLPAFDMFLLPSRTESLGYVLLEAGLARLPAVASHVGGIPEIIEHEKTGLLVQPDKPEALASALKKVKDDKNLRTEYATNLHHKVKTEFSFSDMLRKTKEVYEG